jgi:hypothetical protein
MVLFPFSTDHRKFFFVPLLELCWAYATFMELQSATKNVRTANALNVLRLPKPFILISLASQNHSVCHPSSIMQTSGFARKEPRVLSVQLFNIMDVLDSRNWEEETKYIFNFK